MAAAAAEGPGSGRGSMEEGLNCHDAQDDAQPDTPEFVELDPSGRFGRFDQVLGRGAFKVVYKAFDNQEGMEVAWNQVRVSDLLPSKDGEAKDERERLMKEIKMLQSLKHKNIMTFYHYWWDPKAYAVNFITELFTSGTLRQYRKRHKGLKDEVLKRWAWQILCGLVYLHGHTPPIIHRDLKCDNIFINGSDGTVKIGDLGLATLLRSRTAPQSVLGTPEFMAPELYEENYDAKVDVYSFGMCLLELATMEYPYSECKNAAQIYRKVSLGIRPKALQDVHAKNPELAELIDTCIKPYEQRPESRVLLKHPYFKACAAKGLASRSDGAQLANAAGGSLEMSGSEYGGSMQSAAVSRTVSSIAEGHAVLPGVSSGHPALGASASRDSVHGAMLSRTVSGAEMQQQQQQQQLEQPQSDGGSIRSQRSNVSELQAAAAVAEAFEDDHGRLTRATGSVAGSRPGSAAASKPASPLVQSPQGSPKVASPTDSEGTRCDATDRRFLVVGKYQEEQDKFNLRLRIKEPGGYARTVEFEFDLSRDTAVDVASEMVEDLQLSQEDAAVIACAIRAEVEQLSTRLHADVSLNLKDAAEALQQTLRENAATQAGDSLEASPLAHPLHGAQLLPARSVSAVSLASNASASSSERSAASAPLPTVAASPAAQVPPPSTFATEVLARGLSPPPHPPLPPGAAAAAAGVPTDFPSPSQRVMRSNSIDAAALLRGDPFSRSSSAVHAREASFNSPHHGSSAADSGALSPRAGILSPAGSHVDKRIPLNKLFENLQDLAVLREGAVTPPLEMQRCATPPAGGPLTTAISTASAPELVRQSSSSTIFSDPGTQRLAAPLGREAMQASIARPMSVPCHLAGAAEPLCSGPAAASAPIAAPAGAEQPGSSNASPRSHSSFPTGSSNLADAVARLDVQQHSAPVLPTVGAPALRGSSRDTSPGCEAGLSPTRSATMVNGCPPGGGEPTILAVNGKKPSGKDKEALRKQAADAMKAVEMRSLNLLEGGLMAGKLARGTPMAASRNNLSGSACACAPGTAAAAAVPGPMVALGPHSSSTNLTALASASMPMVHIGAAPLAVPPIMPVAAAPPMAPASAAVAPLPPDSQ